MLARRWERTRAGEGQLVLVVGEPGLGKSRLLEEFHTRLAETPHTWVEWSASQLLQNTPLHPIVEWGRQRFGLGAPAEQRLADLEDTLRLIGLDPAEHAPLLAPLVDIPLPPGRAANFPPEELRRRQLAAMTAGVLAGARSEPVVLAFEDLHWADPTSLDLLRAFADRGAQTPLLLLATARPEFRPPWNLRSHHSVISLSPLDRAGVARMVGEISARHALSKELIEGVNERTGGAPLFVEEVTRLLLERGEQGGVQAIPPTLQQSLAARLDRLGPAREVAQVGAVLGRDFLHALLRDVAEIDEPALQESLDRLADADLLFVEGAPPEGKYRFKHALIQDAAYDSLLKSRRQVLHRRAAEALREASAEPEEIAHHFTEAGRDDLAIEWWGKAGDQALRRSAFKEAIALLGKAIEMADKAQGFGQGRATNGTSVSDPRLKLQTDYSRAVMWSEGYASKETKVALARIQDQLSAGGGDAAECCVSIYGQWIGSLARGEMKLGREWAEAMLREAESASLPMEVNAANRLLGVSCWFLGEIREAHRHLELALNMYHPERDAESRFRFTMDTRIGAKMYLALTTLLLGRTEEACKLAFEAISDAVETGHAGTIVSTCAFAAVFATVRGDAAAARAAAARTGEASREYQMQFYIEYSDLPLSWAHGRLEDRESGAAQLRRALATYTRQGNKAMAPLYQALLAEFDAESSRLAEALEEIDTAIALADETGERWTESMLHRVRGEILLKRDPADLAPAEGAFLTAIAVAKQQGTRSFELRAALALAKLYWSTARPAEAHAILAPALDGFAPTPEFPEIEEALEIITAIEAGPHL
jgi:predicted ATPase